MTCKCGNVLSDTLAPNDVQLRVYTDKEWDEIIQNDTIDPITIPFPKFDVWHCNKCDRIYVFNWENGKAIKTYVLEED